MTLDEMTQHPPGVLDALPIDVLANLYTQANAHLADAQQEVAILHGVLSRRYADGLNDTGTFHRTEGGFDIKITVPKSVSWEQDALAKACDVLRQKWEEDPSEYVDTKLSVPESKYKAWPSAIRDVFEPARTVKPGKPKFEICETEAA